MTEPFQTANWNEKFQEIVEKPAITEEAALQKGKTILI